VPLTPEEQKRFLEAQAHLPDWKELNPKRKADASKPKTRLRLKPVPKTK